MELIDVISQASKEVDFNNTHDATGYATLILTTANEYCILFDTSMQ